VYARKTNVVAAKELEGGLLRLWTAAYRHWAMVAVGILFGALVAFLWIYQVSWGHGQQRGVHVERRVPGTYVTSVNAVIDTAEFGIGRSDTDMYRLSLLAPTYAQLITSDPVMQKVEAKLGGPIDAEVIAEPVPSSPMIKLTVEGTDSRRLGETAVAVVGAFGEYLQESQGESQVPLNLRIAIRGVGQPSEPTLVSNRQVEIGLIAFCLPVATALAFAYRVEYSS